MTTFLINKASAGYPAAAEGLMVIKQTIDLAAVKDANGVVTNLTAADTLDPVIKLPAGCAVLSAGIRIKTAMVGGTSPTVSLGDSAGASNYISALSLGATANKEADGTLWETTGNVIKSAQTYNADDYLRLSFGGTFPASSNGVITVWAVVARCDQA